MHNMVSLTLPWLVLLSTSCWAMAESHTCEEYMLSSSGSDFALLQTARGKASKFLGEPCADSWVATLAQRESRIFSQNGEDGVLRAIFERLAGASEVPKFYVEFGVQAGTERNTRYLQETYGWQGLLLDGSNENGTINLHKELITPSNIVNILDKYDVPKQLGLLSVDIDSYDFWVLKAILEASYMPDVIITEVNSQVSEGLFTVAPPQVTGKTRLQPGESNFGATPEAFSVLGDKHGYKMIHCEMIGVNCFLVREALLSPTETGCIRSNLRQEPRYLNGGACWPTTDTLFYELDENLSVKRESVQPERVAMCSRPSLVDLGKSTKVRFVDKPKVTSEEDMANVNVTGMVVSELPSGGVIYTFPAGEDVYVSAELQSGQGWESGWSSQICDLFESIGGRGAFLDVGANIGSFTVPVGRCLQNKGAGGKVVAVEGMPLIAEHLMASVHHNALDNVAIFRYAVSDENTTADTLSMNLDSTNKGGSSVTGVHDPRGAVVTTEVTTLDSIFTHATSDLSSQVFVAKFDIEGFEGHALLGAKKLFSTAPPCAILMELTPSWLENAGTPTPEIFSMLDTAGYSLPPVMPTEQTTNFYYQKDMKACRDRLIQDLDKAATDSASDRAAANN